MLRACDRPRRRCAARGSRRGSGCRCRRCSAGTHPTAAASPHARSRCRRRSGSGPVPELKLKVPAVYLRSHGFGQLREQRADRIEGADVARRIRTRGAADGRLVDQHRFGERARAPSSARNVPFEFAQALPPCALQRRVQQVLDQRALAGARDAGDADQSARAARGALTSLHVVQLAPSSVSWPR